MCGEAVGSPLVVSARKSHHAEVQARLGTQERLRARSHWTANQGVPAPRKQSRPAWRERPQGPPRQVEGAASCHGLYTSGRSRSGSRERSREPPRGLAGAVSKKPAYGQPEQPRLQQRQQPLRQQHAAQPQPEPYTSGWAARSEQPFALVTAVTGAPEGPRTEVIAGCLYHGSEALHTTSQWYLD